MKKKGMVKFQGVESKGLMHYVVFEGDFVALSEVNTRKIDYVKVHGALDIAFNESEDYDIMAVDIIENPDYVQKVYDYMIQTNNAYFNNGIEHLCVLKFHK